MRQDRRAPVRFGSVCSGIEAASAAWEPLGWRPAWFSEIAAFPSRVLAARFPGVKNHGSLVGLADRLSGSDRSIDILVGGTPCQSFSVAGLRGGLADSRGNLALEFARLAAALRPRWVVWENVPGVLSADKGGAFASLIRGLSELRLTPRECERLQGFPDDWTRIDANTKDTPRYAALGNSMAVPVMRWLGERIAMVEGAL